MQPRRKSQAVWWAAIVIVGGALIYWLARPPALPPPSEPLALPDGTMIRVMTTTYGTRHRIGPPLAHVAERMPMQVRLLLIRYGGRAAAMRFAADTSEPTLLIWVLRESPPTNPAPPRNIYTCQLADDSGYRAGETVHYVGYPLEHLNFKVFPRRDRELRLHFFEAGTNPIPRACGVLTLPNPFHRSYGQWKPEPLPISRRTDDVEVTLQRVTLGHGQGITHSAVGDGTTEISRNTNRPGEQNRAWLRLTAHSLGNTNDVWQVAGLEISDATGNRTRPGSLSWDGHDASIAYYPSLWPGETWKLKLDLKRKAGLKPEELLVFKDVPLGGLDWKNTVNRSLATNGVTVWFDHVLRRAPNTNTSWSSDQLTQVVFTNSAIPAGIFLDLLRVEYDTGETNVTESWSASDHKREYSFKQVPLAAKHASFIFAVQTGRTVEFTVKPEPAK
jgi:hypothetical protein